MTTYKGHCHCGQTEWTVKIGEPAHVLCHCDACKLLSGGECTLNTIVPKDDFKITKGDLKTYTYQGDSGMAFFGVPLPHPLLRPLLTSCLVPLFPCPIYLTRTHSPHKGNPVHCYYCSNCTSSPYHHQTVLGDKYVVRTGMLEGAKDWKVALEIFGKDRLGWAPEVAKTVEGPPPS
ncbi:MAG: hypothetical protein Q9207_005022 [Kuettlingeria erythrocarpa]